MTATPAVSIRQWYNKELAFMPGTLFVVATPIGNLDDVSARALRVLTESALIAAEDTRRTAHLLARYAIPTPTTSFHEHNEVRKIPLVLERLSAGQNVALVSDAGTPGVSDPGRRLIRAAREAGHTIVPIPGPSAITTLLMASGYADVPLTFLGFPPNRGKDRTMWFARLAGSSGTVVFFEAPHRIARTLTDLQKAVGDVPVLIGREMTKKHEEFVERPISVILSELKRPLGEYTVALEIGHKTYYEAITASPITDMAAEFGHMSESSGMTRREIIAELARRHGRSKKDVYKELEAAKKSGE